MDVIRFPRVCYLFALYVLLIPVFFAGYHSSRPLRATYVALLSMFYVLVFVYVPAFDPVGDNIFGGGTM